MKKICVVVIILSTFILNCSNANRTSSLEKLSELLGVLWMQKAAEYTALSYQAFNIAHMTLDRELKIKRNKKKAIVVDIDETVLDNTPYLAKTITHNFSYPKNWNKWCDLAKAKPMPGAVAFLNRASKKGITIFYISNRKTPVLEGTMKNLKKYGFPQVNKENIFLRSSKKDSKLKRRKRLEKKYYFIILMGDNLADFSHVFGDEIDKTFKQRKQMVKKYRHQFGRRFIVLPNPNYGDFQKSLPGFSHKMSQLEKDKMFRKYLEIF